jgi:hypothetical protein
MRRIVSITLFALAAGLTFGLQGDPAVPIPGGDAFAQAGGACGSCPKTAPVCCRNCDGTPAYCARSFAFCPECPAP